MILEQLERVKLEKAHLAQENNELRNRLKASESLSTVINQTNSNNINSHNTISNVSNTVIYNYFDQHTIDIFKLVREKYGVERAISYAGKLFRNKNKSNKHSWILDQDLGIDFKSLAKVVNYDSNSKNPCFNITEANQTITKDQDGSKVDRILTNIGINAGLSAHSYLINKATEVNEDGEHEVERDKIMSHGAIYDSKSKETIFDKFDKFQKIPLSKPYLLTIIPANTS